MDRTNLLIVEGRGRERSSSTSACLSGRGAKEERSDRGRSSYGDIPHYNMKMIAFMGKSLPHDSMKRWMEDSSKSNQASQCSFLTEEEKEMAKGVTPRFFKHLESELPEQYCLCKADSVANLSKWEPFGVIDTHQPSVSHFTHMPSLEELKTFAETFVLPTDWNEKKKRKSISHDDEMDVYQLRLADRANELTQRADHLAHLKSSLGVESSQFRKRRNSVYKLFGRSSGSSKEKEEEGNVPDYCEIVDEKGVRYIKYGTLGNILSNLIQFLTMHQNPEQKAAGKQMMIAFVHAYGRVTTSSDVLQWLQTSYFSALEETEAEQEQAAAENDDGGRRASIICATKADTIIQGILLFLVRWLGHRFVPDFTTPFVEGQSRKTPLYGELLQFLSRMPPGHRNNVKNVLDQESSEGVGVQHSASKLLGLSRIGSKFDDGGSPKPAKKEKKKDKMQRNSSLFFTVMNHRSQKLPPRFTLLDLMPEEVSELLTAEDSRLFSNVAVDEFGGKAWTPKLDSGIGVMTHRWNKLGRWAASELVNTKSLKHRVEILKRMINILDECFKANNFFTTMAIISGLNHSAVQRLKKTWKALPERYSKDLSHLEDELSFSQSFRRYRELLADAVEQDKPCIPFLAVHTKDMLFITEAKGNPEWISPSVMNFEKISLIGGIVSQMKACQKNQSKYQVMILNHSRHETIKNFIGRLPNTLPEESLYPCSVENEPRDS